jgi:alkylated DNA repair dioxygenase AlkB
VNTLFDIGPELPQGFTYHPTFISVEEETQLIDQIKQVELHDFIFQGYTANRRVASFGFDYSFDKRALSKGKDIPAVFSSLINKVSEQVNIAPTAFAELLVTEYPIGAVINWHRDAPPFDVIVGISLHADCLFRLRPQQKEKQGRASIISLPVHRRSLYVMQGSSRTEWQHSIAPVKQLRYSITLRTLKAVD